MSERDDTKTKEQLLAEIEALRHQLAARDGNAGAPSEPSFSRPITRREALTIWIAPVILSVPVVAAMRSGSAEAQVPPTSAPSSAPTTLPTSAPTAIPTAAPTFGPAQPVPGPGIAGIAVLGAALAAAGAKLLKDRTDATAPDAAGDDGKAE